MHTEHDLDLLAAFVEGSLEDTAPAEALIESCPECAEVVDAHRTVRAAIGATAVEGLTDLERRRMRNSVWDTFSAETAPSTGRSNSPWWYRVVPAAAALVVIVGVAANLPSGGDAAATTTTGVALDSAFSAQSEMADTTAPEAAYGELAPAETTAAGAGADSALPLISSDELDSAVSDFEQRAATAPPPMEEAALECVATDADAGNPLVVEEAEVDGEALWMVAFGTDPDQIDAVRVYSQGTCQVLYPAE